MNRQLTIAGRVINDNSDCFVIAEIGHNHQGNLELAQQLIQVAAECGADAVKLQKRDNRSLYTRAFFDQIYNSENSFGPTYGEHREHLEFGWDEYAELKKSSEELGLVFFATAFDLPSVDFLAELGVPAVKIASGDLTNTVLLEHAAQLDLPLIISTGGASMEDVQRAYDAVRPSNGQLCFLQCTASYPADFGELNLSVIPTFRDHFPDAVVGLSSHDNGIAMSVVAYTLGARVIEKHLTLNRTMKGTDHPFSLEPIGFRKMVRDLRRTRIALGDGNKKPHASEADAIRKMSKQLVASRPLPAGHRLTRDDIAVKSPGGGLPPYELDSIIGRKTSVPMTQDQPFEAESLTR